MKETLIVFILFISNTLFAQQSHFVVLEKLNWNQQYKVSSYLPRDWIKEKWNEGYNLASVSFKSNEWFVVVNKYTKKGKQEILINPSNTKLTEMLSDGYTMRDICLFYGQSRIARLYVFVKISTSPVYSGYSVGKYFQGSTSTATFSKVINKLMNAYWQKNKLCKHVKSLTFNGRQQYSFLTDGAKKGYKQLLAYRQDFPVDYISNKKADGFILTSLTYDRSQSKWCVVMTKKEAILKSNHSGNITWQEDPPKRTWVWFNYRSQKDKIEDYINNKGYCIISVN